MLLALFSLNLIGCSVAPDLLTKDSETKLVSSEEIGEIERKLKEAYELWESEEFDQAYTALEYINDETMKSVWPILRSEDAGSTLQLEVHFGKVLWAAERKKSIASSDSARSLKILLLSELNDVRMVEPKVSPGKTTVQDGKPKSQ